MNIAIQEGQMKICFRIGEDGLIELAGVPEEVAREALRLAMHKLPCKCKIVSRADLEGGDNSEN